MVDDESETVSPLERGRFRLSCLSASGSTVLRTLTIAPAGALFPNGKFAGTDPACAPVLLDIQLSASRLNLGPAWLGRKIHR